MPLPSASDDETQILSVPIRLRRIGREITMRIDGTDPFATAKPDARLIKLLIRARRFNAALVGSDVPFAALAKREGVSPSYFTRLVRLSYLAPDITQAILDGRQPRDASCWRTHVYRLPGTSNGSCSALLEPDLNSLSHRLIGAAVLEFGPTEIFPRVGGMSPRHARLCRPRRSPRPAHPRKTAASRPRKVNSRERQVRT
jgi:hypothetical protein